MLFDFNFKIKSIYKFYTFTTKTDFRNVSENRKFRRKNKAKPSQSAHFAIFFFFQKITVFIEKRNTLTGFLL